MQIIDRRAAAWSKADKTLVERVRFGRRTPQSVDERVTETMRSPRTTTIMALLFITGACINLEDIRRTEPVRTVNFTGSFEDVAKCVEYRLRGKLSRDPFRKEISVYNSVKAQTNRGVSHYAMTITQTDERGGIVEWFKLPEGEMDQAMVGRFWTPVVNCADEVTRKADPGESAAL